MLIKAGDVIEIDAVNNKPFRQLAIADRDFDSDDIPVDPTKFIEKYYYPSLTTKPIRLILRKGVHGYHAGPFKILRIVNPIEYEELDINICELLFGKNKTLRC